MRMIIAGSRSLTGDVFYQQLKQAVMACPKPSEIVSGGAKGVDQMGERIAAEFGIPVKRFIPNWNNPDGTTNRGAGFIRNGDMAVYASEVPGSVLVAMWDGASRGTQQMIEVAKTYELPVVMVQPVGLMAKDVTPKEPYIFPQSHSSLNVFETCPRQYEAKYITKEVVFQQGAAAKWGDDSHLALEAYLKSSGREQLPPDKAHYQPWGDWVLNRAAQRGGHILVERKTAVKKDHTSTEYWDKTGYLRGKIDVTILYPHLGQAEVFDWKTNDKIKNDVTQLKMYNAFALTDYPQVEVVKSGYIWLKHNQPSPPEITTRDALADVWATFDHKYSRLRDAYMRGVFPPRPNGLCKNYCDVLSCPHNGRGRG